MLPTLIVFGNKTANEVVEAARMGNSSSFESIEKVYYEECNFTDVQIPRYSARSGSIVFNVAVADVVVKQQIEKRCRGLGWAPHTVIHPSAVVSPSSKLGSGCFVGPLSVISANAIVGDFCIVHLHASIGHDAKIGEYCAILPGARISGSVIVGDRVLIGSNAFVNAGVRIGDDCQVDALTYVSRNLDDSQLISVRTKRPVPRIRT